MRSFAWVRSFVMPCAGCLALHGNALAADPGQADSVQVQVVKSRALVQAGRAKEAVRELKQAVLDTPDNEVLRLALASAYVADANDFWALRVLSDYEGGHPPACQARALAALIHIRQANLDVALELLERDGCNTLPEQRARRELLSAKIASLHGKRSEAIAHVIRARSESQTYEEDLPLLESLQRALQPERMPWSTWKLDLGTGWTSNGLAGSPVDIANRGGSTGSPLVAMDGRIRLVSPWATTVRPTADVSIRTLQLTQAPARDLSYVQPGLRPGILFGGTVPRVLVAYSFDAVHLRAHDPYAGHGVWFSEGHRAEYEIEANDSLLAFGGTGRRRFREQGRSRWEVDQGLAMALQPATRLRVMAGVSARWHAAENDAYDLYGGTGIVQLQGQLPAGLEAKTTASLSGDIYPRSKGAFAGSGSETRQDALVRAKAGLWTPSWAGIRLGLDYEYANRNSTAQSYSYSDHRVILHITWTSDSDKTSTHRVGADGRFPLDHGIKGDSFADDTRVRDLMRQDDAAKQSSTCLK